MTIAPHPDLLHENLTQLVQENALLAEDLDRVKQQMDILRLEDQGWKVLFGPEQYGEKTGFTLETLQGISQDLKEEVAASAYPKQANALRQSYTFSKGFIIPGVDQQEAETRPGAKSKAQRFFDHPVNQRYVFSKQAHTENHTASSTTGMLVWLGDDTTKTGRPIPFHEITGVYLNPDFRDEIWGYKRSWDRVDSNGESKPMEVWYLTDTYMRTGHPRPKTLGKKNVKVSQTHTVIDLKFNSQEGWTFGVPDLLAGRVWNKKYLSMIKHGEEVSATLAFYSAKVRQRTQKGAARVGVQVNRPGSRPGSTVVHGQDNEVDVFSSAGKTYDFGGLRVFAAFYAAAVGVPLTDLSADPSAAGASYGSAAALIPSARRMMEDRREIWADWLSRLFLWGTGKAVPVRPEPINDAEPYRDMQSVLLAWSTGLIHPEEARPRLIALAQITPTKKAPPEGFKIPNNVNFDVTQETPKQAASPDQGKANATGGQDGKDKQDLLSKED